MYYNSKVLIIKNNDYRESDKLVTIFSEKHGKTNAIAKGVKKPSSSLRACVQPFCHSFLFVSKGKSLDLITQGKLIDFYGNCREDLTLTLYSIYIMELLDKSLMEKVAIPNLYNKTVEVLSFFNNHGSNNLILRFYELQLLNELGYKPVVDCCVVCGSKEYSSSFSLQEGGIVCKGCSKQNKTMGISGEVLALLKLFLKNDFNIIARVKASPNALKQLEYFFEKYLEYHLERRFNTKNTIKVIKKALKL
ncbi:DNA recombination and repair protein RecO [Candidatus Syntrophocurvum alkaliphilum]|uniref:DNA repair protein RecO n=1 Tax=Candidatus Syntrophocurvum alkaliphilum TaxID=2293317 RepID=A0A6I6DB45_9FIRM|nr:DNA repair protein RecO [Candidatus Syntrophocurvum alkaliphilum]QGT99978.1 DNA recombination and repair protein RecO [Candidatus Syntrophocurvum alkaliphilum]